MRCCGFEVIWQAQYFGEVMKKSVVKRSLAVVIIVGIFLTLVGLLVWYSRSRPPIPSFRFLSGQGSALHVKDKRKSLYRTTRDIYSFEADFNDVCADANAELTALGFVDETPLGHESSRRVYSLQKKVPGESVWIRILDKHKIAVYSTPESSEYSSPELHAYHYRDGWVSVEVKISFPSFVSLIFRFVRSATQSKL